MMSLYAMLVPVTAPMRMINHSILGANAEITHAPRKKSNTLRQMEYHSVASVN